MIKRKPNVITNYREVNVIKITIEQLEELFSEGELTVDDVEYIEVEVGEWQQEHKTQTCEIIFTDGLYFYQGFVRRSGSPFTDWIYDSEVIGADELADISYVVKKIVYVERWVHHSIN